jgi:hypothetical protein
MHDTENHEVEIVSFLMGRAEQWFALTIGSVNNNWEELRDDFCNSFSFMEMMKQWYNRIASLPMDILEFEQAKEESVGAAWDRFLCLLASDLNLLSLPKDVSLYIFCMRLDMDAALELDTAEVRLFTKLQRK